MVKGDSFWVVVFYFYVYGTSDFINFAEYD